MDAEYHDRKATRKSFHYNDLVRLGKICNGTLMPGHGWIHWCPGPQCGCCANEAETAFVMAASVDYQQVARKGKGDGREKLMSDDSNPAYKYN